MPARLKLALCVSEHSLWYLQQQPAPTPPRYWPLLFRSLALTQLTCQRLPMNRLFRLPGYLGSPSHAFRSIPGQPAPLAAVQLYCLAVHLLWELLPACLPRLCNLISMLIWDLLSLDLQWQLACLPEPKMPLSVLS